MKAVTRRNPGPIGGYHLLVFFHRVLPAAVYRACVAIGSWIALWSMPRQRRASRVYLRLALGREPSSRDLFRHFDTFANTLIFRMLASTSKDAHLQSPAWHGQEFMDLVHTGRQLLYGTFHIGCSDLLGYALSDGFCPVSMVRLRVANSYDTERFSRSYKGVSILWANEPGEVLLGIHNAIGNGSSIALQCDRCEFSCRTARFTFMGRQETFPITVYHLSALYGMPVAFCFAIYNGKVVETFAPKPFFPSGTKSEVLKAGHEHFQQVLRDVERLLAQYPYHWFNFYETDAVAANTVTERAEPHTGAEQDD